MTARIYYLRSAKKNQDGRGDPIAAIMSEVDREAGAIRYSIAAAHKQDEFSKPIGRKIAAGRLEMSPRVLAGVNIPKSGHQISRIIMGDIIQQVDILTTLSKKDIEEHFAKQWFYHIPAKVGAAAKRWLKKANEPKSFQQKTWTAKDLTASTTANLTSHVVPFNLPIPNVMGWSLVEGRIGATLSPIAALIVRHDSYKWEHTLGVDLDKGILLSDAPMTMTATFVQAAIATMNEHRNAIRAAQEETKRQLLDHNGIRGVGGISLIEVQTQNAPPPTLPDLPTNNKNEPNRTQKPWGDGEYPSGKVNSDVKPTEGKTSTLSDVQQRNYDYFQGQLPSLLKNTFVKGRFVVVANMQIWRAFDSFAVAYSYALGEWKPDEFIIQEVNDQPKNIFNTTDDEKSVSPKMDEFLEQMRSAAEERERIAKNMIRPGAPQ